MTINYKEERDNDLNKVINSSFPRKVILAPPGTGKSTLLKELIRAYKSKGKNKFLAITFIGKLCDSLSDDLCGLAETTTIHGFARKIVIENLKWGYYPKMHRIIKEDLENEGIKDFTIDDDNYKKKSYHYKMAGDDDVIYYALDICKNNEKVIPLYDLILIDEFQDFNKTEAEFVDILSLKNDMIIVGDDDQALYTFRGSSPDFIRDKYDTKNDSFESHTLRFCYRCTSVIINYFHNLIEKYSDILSEHRVKKDYVCYLPKKDEDCRNNSFIYLIKQCPPGQIAYRIRKELNDMINHQKIKDVLVIGEPKKCKAILMNIARTLINYGFKNVEYQEYLDFINIKQDLFDAYKFISSDEKSLIGWRILNNPTDKDEINKHKSRAKTLKDIIDGTPSQIKSITDSRISVLDEIIEETPALEDKNLRRELFIKKIKDKNNYLPRPLNSLNITVCNILKAKGLGADVVFLIGFDQGTFPIQKDPIETEIYQMLVSLTRAKKRIYLVNSINKPISSFIDCIDRTDLKEIS